MTIELDTRELEAAVDGLARDEARGLAGRWFSATQEILYASADDLDWDVASVAQAAFPPEWNESRGGFEFSYAHRAARYLNDGTAAHEIEGDPLVFEWEDAPAEVQEMFEETFPTVFLPKTNHPGTPAIRFFERGERRAVKQWGGR